MKVAAYQAPLLPSGSSDEGIEICNDSNYIEPARVMVAQGAVALFIPTNNGMPADKADVVAHARAVQTARAVENGLQLSLPMLQVTSRTMSLTDHPQS